MSIAITSQEELEEYERERKKFWEHVVRKPKRRQVAVSPQPPGLGKGGGGFWFDMCLSRMYGGS